MNEPAGFLGVSPDGWVAIFTFALVTVTAFQGWLTLRAEKLTRQALYLTRQQAIAALGVELPNLAFWPPTEFATSSTKPLKGQPLAALGYAGRPLNKLLIYKFSVKNLGRSPARIVRYDLGFFFGPTLPEQANYLHSENNPFGATGLGQGDSEYMDIDPPFYLQIDTTEERVAESGDLKLWAFCRCHYLDFQDRAHFRSAVWRYVPESLGIWHFIVEENAPADYKLKMIIPTFKQKGRRNGRPSRIACDRSYNGHQSSWFL
jgi:hypothetical protein